MGFHSYTEPRSPTSHPSLPGCVHGWEEDDCPAYRLFISPSLTIPLLSLPHLSKSPSVFSNATVTSHRKPWSTWYGYIYIYVLSHLVVSDSLQPQWLLPARLLCPWGVSKQEYWTGLSCPPPGDLPNPGLKPRSPSLQMDSLPSEPPGKPKNTGVGSLSLLQQIFQTQKSNLGSPALQADSLPAELPGKPHLYIYIYTHTYLMTRICIRQHWSSWILLSDCQHFSDILTFLFRDGWIYLW